MAGSSRWQGIKPSMWWAWWHDVVRELTCDVAASGRSPDFGAAWGPTTERGIVERASACEANNVVCVSLTTRGMGRRGREGQDREADWVGLHLRGKMEGGAGHVGGKIFKIVRHTSVALRVPKVIASEVGNLMPSYVTVIQPNSYVSYVWSLQHLDSVGKHVIVGEIAKRKMMRHPTDVIFNTKKLIGKRSDDYQILEMRKNVPFSIVEGPGGEAWVEIHGIKFSPVEISHLCKTTNFVWKTKAGHNFCTKQSIAGFEILQLIDEPIAAALASTTVKQGLVVVFGMGAGSYSISVLHVSGTDFEIKAHFDDPSVVGGDQFDDLLLDYFVKEITRIYSVDIRGDKHVMMKLVEEVEKTKLRVSIPFLTGSAQGPVDLDITVCRNEFEDLVDHLVEQIQVNCQNMLKQAKLTDDDIGELIIMGGMTRVPKIQRIVTEVFGRNLSTVNTEEAIVIGSSLQSALIVEDHQEMNKDFLLLSIGVEYAKRIFMRVIPRHTALPTKTAVEIPAWCRECLSVRFFLGEHAMIGHNKFLGEIELCINNQSSCHGPATFELTVEIEKDYVVEGVFAKSTDDQLEGASHVKTAVKTFPIGEVVLKHDVKNALLDWPMHNMAIRA
uniref:Uncharacterized protein n=1 Tax=Leersia perrieri TaxID=77586 RepID=A0A0D9X6H9_9ORYZ